MTVSYQYDVASTSSGGFIRLLFKWKGSVWKLVYTELLLLTTAYGFLSLLYRHALSEPQKRSRIYEEFETFRDGPSRYHHRRWWYRGVRTALLISWMIGFRTKLRLHPPYLEVVFELLVYYCSTFMEMIPLSFMLGFYVTFTATRWWNQYMAIPWPDRLMNVLMMYVPGQDDGSRMLRRTLMRYLNLSLILVLRSISKAVKRRFPTKDHLIEAGFMTKLEVELWQSIPSTEFNTFWVPCTWFINLLREARNECRITDAQGVKLILEEFNDFRAKCGLLWSYDWISIPLVYTQVVTMATYSFFAAAVFGRQYIHSPDPIIDSRHHFDFYVPVFTVIQYFLYMGLLKVAEQLINPFGDDDEDFELNWIIDRHFKVSYLGVDTLDGPPPPLVKDSYFHKMDYQLPYTAASVSYKKKTYRGSVAYMHVPQKERGMVVPEMSEEDDEDSPRNGGSGGEDDDGRHGLSKRSSSSLWTLMHRRSNSPPNDNVESGLAQDSKLHVYFKGSSPSGSQEDSEDANGLSDGSQQKHLLQAPEERRSDRQGPEPSPLHGQRSFLKELFSSKPAMRVQAWTGADGDYASPAKRPRKHHHRAKVSFCAETSGRPRFDKSSLRLKSRSTSDLAADMAAALKPALLLTSALGSSTVPGHRRKSLGGDQHLATTVPETVTHSHSLPELLVPDTMPPAPLEPGPPDKPVCTRVPATATSAEPATVIAPTRRRSSQLDASVDPMTPVHIPVTSPQSALVKDSLKPPSTLGQARPRERSRTATTLGAVTKPDGTKDVAMAVPLRKAAILTAATAVATAAAAPGLPPLADPGHPKLPDSQPPTTLRRKPRLRVRVSVPEESDVSDGSGSKPATETSEAPLLPPGSAPEPAPDVSPSSPPPVEPPDKGKRTRSRPKETTEKTEGEHSRVRKISGEDKDKLGFHKDKHKADDSDDNKPKVKKEPEKETTTKDPSQTGKEPKSESSEKVESDEGKDDVEFVVFIQEKAPDRPKQLIIVPGPPQRAGSVDSLLGDSRPSRAKRRASLDSGVQADDDPAHASERKERTTQAPKEAGETSVPASLPTFLRSKTKDDDGDGRGRQRRRASSIMRARSPSSSSRESRDSQECLALLGAAAAPVHRRVPSDVLMRWQNVFAREPGESLERPKPRVYVPEEAGPSSARGQEMSTLPIAGRVKQLSQEFSYQTSSSARSVVTVRSSTASVARAESKAEAFVAKEKRKS